MISTTHGKAYNAFIALSQIRSIVKGMDALHVFYLKNSLKDAVDFMAEEEMRYVKEAGGTVTENGMVIIPDKEKRAEYMKARKELDEMPYEANAEPVIIQIERCLDVTGEQIESLSGFVMFTEEASENGDK